MIEAVAAAVPARTRTRRARVRPPTGTNVVPLRQRLLPRHAALLARWLEAGRPMGLCDAAPYWADRDSRTRSGTGTGTGTGDYALIWVREASDPAYMIRPEGLGWAVIDALRNQHLGNTRGFGAALRMIRPVLTLDADSI